MIGLVGRLVQELGVEMEGVSNSEEGNVVSENRKNPVLHTNNVRLLQQMDEALIFLHHHTKEEDVKALR